MRASAFVGRVGGLAVALGIGAAAVGAAAPVWAAPDTAGSSDSDATAQTDSTAAAPRRAGRSPAQRHDSRPASAAARNSDPTVSDAVPAPRLSTGVRPTDRSASRVATPALVESNPVAAQSVSPVADSAVAVTSTASATVMTPAPAAASAPVGGTVESAPTTLLGTNPAAPVGEPLSWAVLAVARRDRTAKKVTASATTASQTASPLFNQTPTLNPVQTGEDPSGIVTGFLNAVDPDGDAISLSVTTMPLHGTVSLGADGSYTYTPTSSVRSTSITDSFAVTVSDVGSGFHFHGLGGLLNLLTFGLLGDNGHSQTMTVHVVVSATANSSPVANVTVGTPNVTTGVVTGSVTATDADRGTLTYSTNATTAKGTVTVNASTGAFTYTPNAAARHAAAKSTATAADKIDTFTVTVSDEYGGAVAVPVTVTISPKNTAPVSGATTVETPNANTGVVTGTVSATDADSDTLSYSGDVTTAKGTVTVDTGTGAFTYTPTATARASADTDSFTVTVIDGYGGSTPIVVSVPITASSGVVTPAKVTYVFNYTSGAQYWTPEAKAALQSSADAVAAYIVVSQPVTLTFDVTAANDPNSNTMASTGSDLISSYAGFYNTVVQNKILTGVDSNGATADGYIDVNFGTGYALSDTVSASQYDFKSTMMHEMLHAYGFLSYVDQAGYNRYTQWTKFDSFIGTSGGAKVINASGYKFNTAYNTNLTGGNGGLYFLGANAVAAYGGPVPLYTPKPWEAGSSVSHLDDSTFTGARAQLMNAMADAGMGIRTLSAVELGVLKDIGYTVNQNPAAVSMLFVGVIFLRRRRNR